MINLQHKTAVITGATSGIGKAVAKLLAQKGCNLICTGRNKERLANLKNEIPQNIEFVSYECDIADEKEVTEVAEKIAASPMGIDILIHSAGAIKTNSVCNSAIEEYQALFNLNVKAPFLITKLLLPKLKENKGQILFVNSSVTQRAIPNLSLYSASKFALKGFADCLRQEINKFGVRVVSIYPGQTATPMQQALYEKVQKEYIPEKLIQPDDIATIIIHNLQLSATAEITDLHVRPLISKE